ncbi:hypothetical protein H9P43_008310 [Blastocladiella emersonii ATCC 22665]|nr:hypothetical protein H9P43_008310 [Blastocladiella emersonii ATCC 22665]
MKFTTILATLAVLATYAEAGYEAPATPAAPAPAPAAHKKCKSGKKHYKDVPLAIPKDQYVVAPAHPGDKNYTLKTGPNGEYMGDSRGAYQAKPADMYTVPVPRKSYEPRTTVKAAYVSDLPAHKNPLGKPAVVVADCEFKTKRPTLNLDNFVQIKKIACSDAAITLSFDSDASAAKAAAEWSKAKDLAVLVGREWKCNGKDATNAREITAVAAPKGTELVLKTNKISKDQVIDEYEIKVGQYSNEGLAKRDFWNWSANKSKKFALGLNYDVKTSKVIRPSIPLVTSRFGAVSLENLYAMGEAEVSFYIKGSTVVVKEYQVALGGQIKANMDILLRAYQFAKTDLVRVNIFVLPLAPVGVPGLFSFNPEFRLAAGVQYWNAEALDVTAGFSFNFPWNWKLSGTGLFSKPTIQASGKPTLDVHPLAASKDIDIGITAHLIPEFGLSMSILSLGFDMNIGLDNEWGATLQRGSYAGCPNGLLFRAWAEHELDFAIRSALLNKRFTLWTSGVLELAKRPHKCLPSTTTTSQTATATSTSTSATSTTTSTTATTTSASTTTTSAKPTTTSSSTTTTTSATTTTTAVDSVKPTSTSTTTTSATTTSSSTTPAPTSTSTTTSATTSTSTTTSAKPTSTSTTTTTSSSSSSTTTQAPTSTSTTTTSSSTTTQAPTTTSTSTSTTTTSSSSSTKAATSTSTSTSSTSTSSSTTTTTKSTEAPTPTATSSSSTTTSTSTTSIQTGYPVPTNPPAYGRKPQQP